ncbi:DNA primase [Cerasicoccus frondis]|uniref:DNA primase n=1 Tax=Cerasicoccus frondis TaxID=490090 RepID=UPI002852682E|nr:DNA primase [Cerasicoccus frondis]
MPRISRNCIETIRQQVSLVDVAGLYTQMKRAGAQWRGLSPFNTEKTPSFYVHPEKNVFHDYSSGNAGDLFRFVMLKENLGFNESIEFLAERYNVPLEYDSDGMTPERASLRKELFQIHEVATDYFHRAFHAEHPEAEFIRNYWTEKRKFPLELADEFKIGLAPSSGEGFVKYIVGKGFSIDALKACGLLYIYDNARDASRARPRFRGRLMIPIRDIQGRVIAFTARQTELVPDDDNSKEAKYVNSPETPLFSKSNVLFGLDHARKHIDETKPFVLVEGQLDCLRCFQQGVHEAVAPQGTAITENQLSLLRKYTPKVEVLLDGDRAGQKAAMRMLPLALAAGLEVHFLPLPPGLDPDDLLCEKGAGALDELRENRLTAIRFAVNSLMPNPGQATPRDKAAVLETMFSALSGCDSAVVRGEYLDELAHLTRTDRTALETDFRSHRKRDQRAAGAPPPPPQPENKSTEKLTSAESVLLFIALHRPDLAQFYAQTIDHEWLDASRQDGRLLGVVLAEAENDQWEGVETLEPLLENEDERNYIYQLLTRELNFDDPVQAINECIRRLFELYLRRAQQNLEERILNANASPPEETRALHQERIRLRRLKLHPPTIELPT